jgi:hypothetical protein
MSGSGKGDRGRRRRPFRGRAQDHGQPASADTHAKKADFRQAVEIAADKNKKTHERPQWTPPKMSTEPLPIPDCPYCGKPIKEITMAISDKTTGQAVHFDCVISRISQNEKLEHGEIISYIGGGRFGIVRHDNNAGTQGIIVKKIFEWEIKENRAEWRQAISDHFSVT